VDHEPIPIMEPKLQDELWFHGYITRQHAEALLKHVSYYNLFLIKNKINQCIMYCNYYYYFIWCLSSTNVSLFIVMVNLQYKI